MSRTVGSRRPAGRDARRGPWGRSLAKGAACRNPGSARGHQLLLEVLDLPLQAVVLTPQALVAALQAFVLVSQARAVAASAPGAAVSPASVASVPDRYSQRQCALVGHTRECAAWMKG